MQFSMKIWILLFFRVFLGMLNNIVISVALKLIPISKGIIIQSSSPIFVFIAASIFLKEHVTKFQLAMTLASIFGVYLMTLNKVDETYDKTYEIIGYLTMCCSPLFYGWILVIFRSLALNNVNLLISPLYLGLASNVQTLFLYLFTTGYINFEYYRSEDIKYWIVICICQVTGQWCIMRANKYWATSNIAPILYLENVITFLADVFLFDYQFVVTDILGMLIIVSWLVAPIFKDICIVKTQK